NGRARAGRRLLTVGTDCSVGKMYTTLALERAMRRRGCAADFRATGQTGIFVAGAGVPVDAVVADFISGAVEWISPARDDGGWDLIEGQGSLFHPSYAGVSLGLLHGAQPDALVLCHEPTRRHMRGLPGYPIPELRSCLEANLAAARLTNPTVRAVGVALNTSGMSAPEALAACQRVGELLELPCQDPVTMGVEAIVDHLFACFAN
ncbi:MAG: NAD-dependent epimerase/dehydratase family protein, partial [Rhodanobacter sp.]